jgi:hypothetical protein
MGLELRGLGRFPCGCRNRYLVVLREFQSRRTSDELSGLEYVSGRICRPDRLQTDLRAFGEKVA